MAVAQMPANAGEGVDALSRWTSRAARVERRRDDHRGLVGLIDPDDEALRHQADRVADRLFACPTQDFISRSTQWIFQRPVFVAGLLGSLLALARATQSHWRYGPQQPAVGVGVAVALPLVLFGLYRLTLVRGCRLGSPPLMVALAAPFAWLLLPRLLRVDAGGLTGARGVATGLWRGAVLGAAATALAMAVLLSASLAIVGVTSLILRVQRDSHGCEAVFAALLHVLPFTVPGVSAELHDRRAAMLQLERAARMLEREVRLQLGSGDPLSEKELRQALSGAAASIRGLKALLLEPPAVYQPALRDEVGRRLRSIAAGDWRALPQAEVKTADRVDRVKWAAQAGKPLLTAAGLAVAGLVFDKSALELAAIPVALSSTTDLPAQLKTITESLAK
jgi:hypothetical protein